MIISKATLTDLHKKLSDEQRVVAVVFLDLALNAVESTRLTDALLHAVDVKAPNSVLQTFARFRH